MADDEFSLHAATTTTELGGGPSRTTLTPSMSGIPSDGHHLASPPESIITASHVSGPDPFLVDDPDDPVSEDEEDDDEASEPSTELLEVMAPSQEIALTPTSAKLPLGGLRSRQDGLSEPQISVPLNVQKAVPPPPPDGLIDEEAPDLCLPSLITPTMFLPIPNTDPLTTLLMKYIPSPEMRPARDTTGEWQNTDFHTLVMSNRWRALARMSRDRLVQTNPEDIALILNLWYIRLSSLARLRLFNQTSAECTNLFTVLYAVEPTSSREWLFERLMPFELEVMHIRLKYWAGDHLGYLDALNALLSTSRRKARAAHDESGQAMWKERGARVALIIASQMIEMKDFIAAAKILKPLCDQPESLGSSHALRSALARIYLQAGYLSHASKQFLIVDGDPEVSSPIKQMNKALLASAKGDWVAAANAIKPVLEDSPGDAVAANNLAVALLGQGRLKEAIEVMDSLVAISPAAVTVAEPYLFNLSTLYELHSTTAWDKKRGLLIKVANHSGDGLKTTCLKMPTT